MHFEIPTAETAALDVSADAQEVGIVYCRTAAQSSCMTQQSACRDYCERNGIAIGATFIDHGIASSTPLCQRTGFAGLLVCLRRGHIAAVIVDDATRIARSLPMLIQGVKMIEARGAVVWTADGRRLSAADLRQLLLSVADLRDLPRLRRG